VTVNEAAVSRPPIWARFWRDRRGVVGVALAVLLPVLFGFAGIGIEVGLWFAIQRQNQSAADAAAISAGLEYAAQIESGVTTNPAGAATTTAGYNLFSGANCSTSGTTNCTLYPCYGFTVGSSCNTSGSNGALPNAVQVVLTQPLNTAFANFVTAIWGPNVNTVTVTTTAIAEFSQMSPACLLALDPTALNAVFVDNGTLQNANCWVASNSSSGTALNCNGCTVAGPTTVVGGDTVSNNGHLNGSRNRTYASAIADPYAASLTHAFLTSGMLTTTPCSLKVKGETYTYSPPTYNPPNCVITGGPRLPGNTTINLSPGTQIAGGLSVTGPATVNLSPGTYWVTDGSLMLAGALTCQGCSPGGPGVTIIFTTTQGSLPKIGTLQVPTGQSLILNLNAPSTVPYAGLLIVQDTVPGVPYDSRDTTIGNPSARLSGLLYFPSTKLSFVGTVTENPNCLVAVADSFHITGNITLDNSGCQTAGLTTLAPIFSVFLAV
jgi:Flp pilus assembly protein TadG